MKELENFIALKLLNLKAIKLQVKNPFEWDTGWTAPIYFDSRKLLSYKVRNVIKVEIARIIVERFSDVEAIAAVAPNAIAIGMLVAETLDLPFVHVNTQAKSHGFENRIEGDLKIHQKVVIISDQLSWGVNSLSVQEAIQEDGADVLGMVSILDYEFADSIKALEKARLDYYALTTFKTVMQMAREMGKVGLHDMEEIEQWHSNPSQWKPSKQSSGKKETE